MKKKVMVTKHLCEDCGKPIIPYEAGYKKCRACFFKSKKCEDCGRQIIPYVEGYTKCRSCFYKSQNPQPQQRYTPTYIAKENIFIRFFRWIWDLISQLFIILIVVTVLFLLFGGWSLIMNGDMPTNANEWKQLPQNIVQNIIPEVTGSANPGFPYWSSKTITYSFSPTFVCDSSKVNNVKKAFSIIETGLNNTVHFVESPEAKLVIRCYDSYGPGDASGLTIIQIWDNERISDGTIDFYKLLPGRIECTTYPTLETHEILHALGVAHINSEQSIMYLGFDGGIWTPCRQLDKEIAECLMNIYSNGKQGHNCENIPHQQYQAGFSVTTVTRTNG